MNPKESSRCGWWTAIVVATAATCLVGVGACTGVGASAKAVSRVPIVGLPCEGCEAVFEGLPTVLTSHARIAPLDEPGQAMRIVGTVFDTAGHPVPDVVVYAYHTNARGIYPRVQHPRWPAGDRHGLLRGWVKTDEIGQYRFDTIRPAGYPDTDLPAHVHMHVIDVGRCTYYIDDILFEDDPRLTAEKRRQLVTGRAGSGLVLPEEDGDGTLIVTRNILLGLNIPGYNEGARQPTEADDSPHRR